MAIGWLTALALLPMLGAGVVALVKGTTGRLVGMGFALVTLVLGIVVAVLYGQGASLAEDVLWIRAFGVHYALGLDGSGGLVERAERFILLAVGLLFPALLLVVLGVIVVLNMITAAQRFVKVWKQAAAPPKALSDRRRSRARRTGRTSGANRADQRSTRAVRRPRR